MSDIPPCNFEIPSDIPPEIPVLPDDVMCEIFERCNGITIQNVRRTCRHWCRIIGSHEFVTRLSNRWSSRGCFLFAHFGYSFTWTTSLDWIMKLDSRTGQATEFTLPFLINHDGWFEVLGLKMVFSAFITAVLGVKQPTYVTLDGAVYWISGTVEGIGTQTQYIASFCIMSLGVRSSYPMKQRRIVIAYWQKMGISTSRPMITTKIPTVPSCGGWIRMVTMCSGFVFTSIMATSPLKFLQSLPTEHPFISWRSILTLKTWTS
ncbi:hypothetical protein PIB30_022169 [Stylosanthes scabra]|uniref:F-box domain-containing protein n=1 Tax=Stylosanthes scabra TaxID=79078 RepID=A0ABU6W8K5_9FABA|nr:hypothetical protein [Stylosanthes scabra]